MTGLWRQLAAVIRLELAELVRSKWLWFCVATYLVLGAALVTVGLRESTIVGFTGTSRVLLSFTHALLLVLPLLALIAIAPAVGRARDDGALELLLTQPLSRTAWFAAVCVVRYVSLVVPLAAVLVAIGLWGQLAQGDPIPWSFVGRTLAISASLLAAYTGIGAAISVFVRNPARVTTYLVLAWALGVALLDFGLIGVMLRWRIDPHAVFTLAALNPVEASRLALLSGLEPDLASFGPVGFYLANRLGSGWLLILGLVWPTALGAITWVIALIGFRKTDQV